MENATITFPMFGNHFAIDIPNTYTVFGHVLHWYGAIIAFGFILAYFYVTHRVKDFGMSSDEFTDMLIFAVPSAVVGARLYYVIFNFSLYRNNLSDFFRIWAGGLAIYGGVLGAVIAVIIFCHVKRTSAGAYFDVASFGLLIGQTIGRWGNFINREAYGSDTSVFCRMGLTNAAGQTIYVHPTFLYESLWNTFGFILLHVFSKKIQRKYDGQIFAMYIAWYGLGRMFIEGLRTDSLYLFNTGLRVSQVLAGMSFLTAMVFLLINFFSAHDSEKMLINRVKAVPDSKLSSDLNSGGTK